MAEGTPSSDVFGFVTDEAVAAIGLDDDEPTSDDSIAPVDQTEASPEASASAGTEVAEQETDEQTEPEEDGQPSEDQPHAGEVEETKVEEAKAEEEPPKKIFGRFDTEEQAEASYKSMQALQKRTAERANALEGQLSEAMGYLKKVAPIIQQLNQQQSQQVQAVPENFDPSDPQQLQQFVNQQVEAGVRAKLTELVPQLTQQQTQNQAQQQMVAAVTQFQSEVPDFYEGSDTWNQMDAVIRGFQTTDKGLDVSQFPLTVDNLRLAHKMVTDPALYQVVEDLYVDPTDPVVLAHAEQAAKDPTLLRVLKATPDWIRTPEGMELAKSTARASAAFSDVDNQASQPNPQQNSQTAFVETGGAGAPSVSAPGRVPDDDDWEETVRWWRGNQENVFGFTGAQS